MSSKSIILGASVFTVIWVVGLGLLVQSSRACVEEGTLVQMWVSCRNTNEIGDFLAGSFAPLAFLWLVATVLIQSSALSKQSEELALAREEQGLLREETRLTRKALEAQLTEVQKNVEISEKQLKIQSVSLHNIDQKQNEADFEALMNIMLELYFDELNGKRLYSADGKTVEIFINDQDSSIANRLRDLCDELDPAFSSFSLLADVDGKLITQVNLWVQFAQMLTLGVEKLDRCSNDFRQMIVSTGVVRLNDNLTSILEL